jgi:hypothetical protein
MLNGHVVDLASRVSVGTTVTVVRRLPGDLARVVSAQVGARGVERVGRRASRPWWDDDD